MTSLRISFLNIFIAFISFNSFSQSLEINTEEDFNGDDYIFSTGDWENISAEVKHGEFIINRTKETSYHYFDKTRPIDYTKPFEYSCKFKQLHGATNESFGLIWGRSSEESKFQLFLANGNGSYWIGYKDGEYENLSDWQGNDAINKKGKYNELKIIGDGTNVRYLINGVELRKFEMPKTYGQVIAIYIQGEQKLAVDDFRLKTPIREIKLANHKFENHPPVNLGEKINSKYSELLPVISPDGKELYYSRYDDPENLGGDDDYDILKSTKQSNGEWSTAERVPAPLNSKSNNCVVGVPAGGNSLLLMNVFDSEGKYLEEGYSISRKTKTGWSAPEKIDIEGYYNHDDKLTATLSSNQTIMVMSIFTDESREEDLFVSFRKYGNKWSKPLHMGTTINGAGDEFAPFLAPDNRTIYFASTSHAGYGSADIFMSKRLDDTWTNWSEPLNLGKNINSSGWDGYFVLDADGQSAYVVSNDRGLGRADIFVVELPKESQPESVLLIKGKVIDSKTSKPVESEIILNYTTNNIEAGHLTSDPNTGAYEAVLPDTGNYEIFAKAQGYYAYKHSLHTEIQNEYQEIEHDLELVPLEKGQNIVLKNIFFVRSKAEILPTSNHELEYLVNILKENPEVRILIGGHTDNTGSAKLNQKLSQDRADKIMEYLVDNGINKKRLEAKGYGGTQPIAKNFTESSRRKNRRVEFTIQ